MQELPRTVTGSECADYHVEAVINDRQTIVIIGQIRQPVVSGAGDAVEVDLYRIVFHSPHRLQLPAYREAVDEGVIAVRT